MRKVRALILFILVFSLTSCTGQSGQGDLDQGKLDLAAGKYEEALDSFKLALDKRKDDKELSDFVDILKLYIDMKGAYDNGIIITDLDCSEDLNNSYIPQNLREDMEVVEMNHRLAKEIEEKYERVEGFLDEGELDEAEELMDQLNLDGEKLGGYSGLGKLYEDHEEKMFSLKERLEIAQEEKFMKEEDERSTKEEKEKVFLSSKWISKEEAVAIVKSIFEDSDHIISFSGMAKENGTGKDYYFITAAAQSGSFRITECFVDPITGECKTDLDVEYDFI